MHRAFIVLFVLLLSACSGATNSDHEGAAENSGAILSPGGHFEFHADPWISLHHFLFHAARADAREMRLRGRVPLDEGDVAIMTPEIIEALELAYTAYAPYLDGNLLFTPELRQIAIELAKGGPDAVSDEAVRMALVSIMPAYEQTLWPRHREASEKLVSKLTGELETYEAPLAERVALYLESDWPATPIRVDASAYASRSGAYTDQGPNHITLSAYDEQITSHSLEMLFHEASHTTPLGDNLFPMMNIALEQTGATDTRSWHYALFYLTGRATGEVLGDADYIPYSEAVGLSTREGPKDYYDGLAATWDEAESLQERLTAAAGYAAQRQTASEDE
jgi:hypothetical protein